MASIKSLTEAQCGSEAPLVILSNNVSQSRSFMRPENLPAFSSKADLLSQEYLLNASADTSAPTTFDMTAILQQCPPSSYSALMQSGQQVNSALLHKWCAEYEQNGKALVDAFVKDYANSRTEQLNEAWNHASSLTPISPVVRTTQQFQSNSQLWASDFLDKFDSVVLSDTTTDSIASNIRDTTKADLWINEFLSNTDNMSVDYKEMHDEAYKIFSNYENEWHNMSANLNNMSYKFSKDNVFADELNPVERAQEFFKQGNIVDAVLCYEAALQRNPNDAESWCSLGLCHAENEQDVEAIAAYRRSLDLDPVNRRTLLASAVSMANEGVETAAMRHLDQWLLQFTGDQSSTASKAFVDDTFIVDSSWIKQLEEKFMDVISHSKMSAERLSELYNALGVFYNLTNNFEKAVESMKAAISINPADAVLWNRLGASLANNDRSPEAIGAYRKALELFPAYVRARYNLGVSCMNMNAFRDAIGHFLSALRLQKSRQNTGIWSKLRSCILRTSSLSSLDDTSRWVRDAMDAVEARDIDAMTRAYTRALVVP